MCSRCVRACNEVQGTFALTVEGRGFDSHIVASQAQPFFESECVSCGACVESCPTGALVEKTMIKAGAPAEVVTTTCAYCGVGCSFEAEVKDQEVVRMVPSRDGKANRGPCLRQGAVRLRLCHAPGPDHQADDPQRRSPTRGAKSAGKKPSSMPRRNSSASRRSTAGSRWVASLPRDAPTRKRSWCRSWCALRWARTTWIPARASAIRPPDTD